MRIYYKLAELVNTPSQFKRANINDIVNITASQDEDDAENDIAGLRELLHRAEQDDTTMILLLQVDRRNMPEAITTLQRAIENEDVMSRASITSTAIGEDMVPSSSKALTRPPRGTSDRNFLETGIAALRRVSTVQASSPSWTITQYEVDRGEKIGIGFFSTVYKGTWRNRTVAMKVLAESTLERSFRYEVRQLYPANYDYLIVVNRLISGNSYIIPISWSFMAHPHRQVDLPGFLSAHTAKMEA